MTFQPYIPSGKYNPFAPYAIFCAVLALSSIIGAICGWLLSEHGLFPYVDLTMSILIISIALYISAKITIKIVRKLQIRSPQMISRMGMIAAMLGWNFFNWATRYMTLAGPDTAFVDFIIIRMNTGFPVGLSFGVLSSGVTINFMVQWFMVIPIWLIELWIMPFLFARILAMQAGLPFSEKNKTWHKQIILPYTIYTPAKKTIRSALCQKEVGILRPLHDGAGVPY